MPRSNEDEAEDWISMGLDFEKRGFFDKAEKAFQKATEVASEYPRAWLYLGVFRKRRNQVTMMQLRKPNNLIQRSRLTILNLFLHEKPLKRYLKNLISDLIAMIRYLADLADIQIFINFKKKDLFY